MKSVVIVFMLMANGCADNGLAVHHLEQREVKQVRQIFCCRLAEED